MCDVDDHHRNREQTSYQWSAIAASTGITTIALAAVYLRFQWHMVDDGSLPWLDMAATCLLVGGGVVFMEFWARWAHKVLWHDYAPGWALHKSHHEPRLGPFEANDVFAIVNAVPAIALCAYGLFREDVIGGVCFGAGLGITVFGMWVGGRCIATVYTTQTPHSLPPHTLRNNVHVCA